MNRMVLKRNGEILLPLIDSFPNDLFNTELNKYMGVYTQFAEYSSGDPYIKLELDIPMEFKKKLVETVNKNL